MKLLIQIPCFNEHEQLRATFADLPRRIAGVDQIEVLIIDDGSTDGTAELATALGVHHVVRFPQNRGLAAAYMAGLDASLRLGADVIVNTDADNQYPGDAIERLVQPVVRGEADIAVGDRQTNTIAHFSPFKRWLQRWGSRAVRGASGSGVADSPSGFRALSRNAAYRLFVHNRYTYTLETVIQAGRLGLAIENVAIHTNPKTRESRLFSSTLGYVRKAGPVILRAYAMYRPVHVFSLVSAIFGSVGIGVFARFLYFYLKNPHYSGYVQSLIVGSTAIVLAFISGLVAMLAELVAANRRLLEEVLLRTRRIEANPVLATGQGAEGVHSTGARPWSASSYPVEVGAREPVAELDLRASPTAVAASRSGRNSD